MEYSYLHLIYVPEAGMNICNGLGSLCQGTTVSITICVYKKEENEKPHEWNA